jgi:PQQ-like domain
VARYAGALSRADAVDVAVSPDGSMVFATGSSNEGTGSTDYATVAYRAGTGRMVWQAVYNGPANRREDVAAIAVSPDGTKVFLTGSSEGDVSTGWDYATVAYDAATGTQLWASRFDGPDHLYDYAVALAVGPDGSNVYVTGNIGHTGFGDDYLTIAYDAESGTELWQQQFDGAAHDDDDPQAVAVSPGGGSVFVTGFAELSDSNDDFVTIAYDALTGGALWTQVYVGPSSRNDFAYDVAVSPVDSTVFVSGASWRASTKHDFTTIAYDASTGIERWRRRYNGPSDGYDYGEFVAVSPDGSKVFVAGRSWDASTGFDYATVAYDAATGSPLWGRRYSGPGGMRDLPADLAVAPDGARVYVTGSAFDGSTTGTDYTTVVYNASDGSLVRVGRFAGAEPPDRTLDTAEALAIGPDGFAYITGTVLTDPRAPATEYVTVSYQPFT